MNTILIKHGSSAPTTSNLAPFELGYVKGGALYINNDGIIQQLTGLAATGLVNSNSYLQLPAITATTTNTDRILVADDAGIVYYKTATDILSEIGALSTANGGTIAKDLTVTGKITANGTIVVNDKSYGTTDPNTAGITGTLGQLYFVITG